VKLRGRGKTKVIREFWGIGTRGFWAAPKQRDSIKRREWGVKGRWGRQNGGGGLNRDEADGWHLEKGVGYEYLGAIVGWGGA